MLHNPDAASATITTIAPRFATTAAAATSAKASRTARAARVSGCNTATAPAPATKAGAEQKDVRITSTRRSVRASHTTGTAAAC